MLLTVSLVGVIVGGLASLIWCQSGRWLADRQFWTTVHETVRLLVQNADPRDFFRQYVVLLRALLAYLGKTAARVGLTVLPVLLTLMLLSPVVSRWQFAHGDAIGLHASHVVTLRTAATILAGNHGHYAWPAHLKGEPITLETADWRAEIRCLGPVIVSNSRLTNFVYAGCGFTTIYDPLAPGYILLRPAAQDANPFWPYFSDLELAFWAALIAGSCLTAGVILLVPSIGQPRPDHERSGTAHFSQAHCRETQRY